MIQSNQSMIQREHPHIAFVELDNAPVASDSASVAYYYNPDEPDPEHLCQTGTPIWSVIYTELQSFMYFWT